MSDDSNPTVNMSIDMSLSRKVDGTVALVTGAAGGIGLATALRLGLLGYRVACCDYNKVDGQKTTDKIIENGGDSAFFHCDVSDEAAVQI